MSDPIWGKYRATVADNADPDGRGRVQFRCDAVRGALVDGWALPCAPFAADGLGFFAVPPIGAHVWVEFEGGDVSRPIWTGAFWDDGESAPAPQLADGSEGDAGDPSALVIRTAELSLTIHDGKQSLYLEMGDAKLSIDGTKIKLSFGSASVELSGGKVKLNDDGLQVT